MAGAYPELVRRLREEGLRLTPQRELILKAISEGDGHQTAAEIYERVRGQSASVTRPTIYRNLERLCRAGLLSAADLGGGATVYELTLDETHHHLICRSCGETLELPEEVFRSLERAIRRRYGFQPQLSHLAIEGLCAECRG